MSTSIVGFSSLYIVTRPLQFQSHLVHTVSPTLSLHIFNNYKKTMYISKCCLWDVGAEWTRKRKSICVFSLLNCFSGLVLWISSCCLLSILVLLHADFTTLTVKLMHTIRFENVYCYTLYSMESSSASLMRMPMTCFTVSCWFILSTVAIISVLSEEWLYIDCLHLGSSQNLQLGLIMLAYNSRQWQTLLLAQFVCHDNQQCITHWSSLYNDEI